MKKPINSHVQRLTGFSYLVVFINEPSTGTDIDLFPIGELVCGTCPTRFLSTHRNEQEHARQAYRRSHHCEAARPTLVSSSDGKLGMPSLSRSSSVIT